MPPKIINNFLGMVSVGDERNLSDITCKYQQDMVCYPGLFATRPGFIKRSNTPETNAVVGLHDYLKINGERVFVKKDNADDTHFWNFATLEDLDYAVDGVDRNKCYDGVSTTNMGITPPPSAPTFNANIDGALVESGKYYFVVRYYNINKKRWSDPSPISAEMTVGSTDTTDGIRINILVDASIDSQVTHAQVGRTTNGESIYYYDDVIAYTGTAITFDSIKADSTLGDVIGELNSDGSANVWTDGVPPACPYIISADSKIYLAGNKPYTTGTVTMTADPTVVGAGTTWVAGMEGMFFQVVGDPRIYEIDSITDGTNLELTETYAGTTGAGKSYYIWGAGNILYWSYIRTDQTLCPESFHSDDWMYVGGNEKITGLAKIFNRKIIFKKYSSWVLVGATAADYYLVCLDNTVGTVSHRSIVHDRNNNVIFVSEEGIHITDGRSIDNLTDKTIGNIFSGESNPPFTLNKARLEYCHSVFDKLNNRYLLWLSSSTSSITDKCLVYDFNTVEGVRIGWSVWNVRANCSAVIEDSNGTPRVYFGDEQGYINYFDPDATNDGAGTTSTVRGTATGGTTTTITDTAATFTDDIIGCWVKVISGTGSGETERRIISRTATEITFTPAVTTSASTDSIYAIGHIDCYREFKWDDFGNASIDKLTRKIRVIFKPQSSDYSLYIKQYENFSSTVKQTKYIDMDIAEGYHSTNLETNRARHFKWKIGADDTDRPVEVREIQVDYEIQGEREIAERVTL